jgi:hypothetical protein
MSFLPDHLAAVDDQLGEWPNRDALPVLRTGIDYVIVSRLETMTFRETIWPAITDIGALCPVGSSRRLQLSASPTPTFALRPSRARRASIPDRRAGQTKGRVASLHAFCGRKKRKGETG